MCTMLPIGARAGRLAPGDPHLAARCRVGRSVVAVDALAPRRDLGFMVHYGFGRTGALAIGVCNGEGKRHRDPRLRGSRGGARHPAPIPPSGPGSTQPARPATAPATVRTSVTKAGACVPALRRVRAVRAARREPPAKESRLDGGTQPLGGWHRRARHPRIRLPLAGESEPASRVVLAQRQARR